MDFVDYDYYYYYLDDEDSIAGGDNSRDLVKRDLTPYRCQEIAQPWKTLVEKIDPNCGGKFFLLFQY